MTIESFVIASRFRGPPNSGNGGYVCGRIAKHLSGIVSVRLKAPPPLNMELTLESTVDTARLLHGTTLIGEARRAELSLDVKPAPTFGQAQVSTLLYAGLKSHPFPGCFVCGPGRGLGDGLRIFAGPVAATDVLASPWVPDSSLAGEGGYVASEFLWAALDCPSGFAVFPHSSEVAVVLGELSASVVGALKVCEPCVVTGWPLGADGRKRYSASAIHTADGRLVAMAKAIWIEVPAAVWGATDRQQSVTGRE